MILLAAGSVQVGKEGDAVSIPMVPVVVRGVVEKKRPSPLVMEDTVPVSLVVSPVKPVILPHGIMPVVTVPVSLITKVSAVSPILRIENTSPAIERRTMRGVIPGAFPIPTFTVRVL